MLSAPKKKELLKRAEELAQGLHQAGVSRAELRQVLTALFLSPGSWAERLHRSRALVETLPQSWVANRSGKTRSQLLAVSAALRGEIEVNPIEEESAFLLGWLARLVHIKYLEQRDRDST